MSRRALLLAAALVLLAAACTGDGGNTPSPAASIDLGTTTPATEDSTPATNPGGEINRLVVLDGSGNIVTIDPDGSNSSQVTDDGQAAGYFQPVWSPVSDRLVWGQAAGVEGPAVVSSAGDGGDRRIVETSSPPFYLNWAPDGSQVGILYGGADGVVLEVVDMENFTSSPIGSASPFYFSWNPDSTGLAVHVGATGFGTIVPGQDLIDLGSTAAIYQAPHWTPAGIFHFAQGGLVLVDPDGNEQIVATLPGEPVFFVANPQGTKVAIESVAGEEGNGSTVALSAGVEIKANAVSILDVTTGEVDVASENPSVGYFWSPDGESLLLLQLTGEAGETDVSVWEDGETSLLTTMTPPLSFFRDVLQFFNQYAQSLRLWSPDSSAVALAGTIDDEAGVWVIPTDGSEPSRVFDGEWVAWSYG